MGIADFIKAGREVYPKERFLQKTLRHTVSFIEDTVFNTSVSSKGGFLQKVEPRLKLIGIAGLIIAVSLKNDPSGISIFLFASIFMAVISAVPLPLLLRRMLPVFLFTSFIALPSALNLIVEGEGIFTIIKFKSPHSLFTITIPGEITITRQGAMAASTLILRATASVMAVFVLTLTTRPDRLVGAVSYFLPGPLKSVFSISYRYIFFLIKRLEDFIFAYRSRNISAASLKGRQWASSRIAALFSISLRLSKDLGMAMESRGGAMPPIYKYGRSKTPSTYDFLWSAFIVFIILGGNAL
jgi:cobalt ECF transporter T component CbiQ